MTEKKIYPECYDASNILYYDFNGVLFSLAITEDVCRRHLLYEDSGVEDYFEWEEHLQREFHGERWPLPDEITKDQMKSLVDLLHDTSLRCTQDEILGLIDYYGDKFKQYRNQ